MRKSIFPILLLASLAGCASTTKPTEYGSYVAAVSPTNEKVVVQDVVKRLVAAYPPARTRLNLRHPATDAFGADLVASMRTKGYALAEYKAAPATAAEQGAYAFAYVFDQPAGTDLYRITLFINNEALSRVYEAKDGSIAPAGYWVRKE
jgi:ABC-type Fe3+-hydroxamate transport system substrate-binding protein